MFPIAVMDDELVVWTLGVGRASQISSVVLKTSFCVDSVADDYASVGLARLQV